MSLSSECLVVILLITLSVCAYADPPQKDGSLADLRALDANANIATKAFDAPVTLDATALDETHYYSRQSGEFELKPNSRYTLGVTYRAQGPSVITAGAKWVIEGEPAGLVDMASIRAAWPQTDGTDLRALTFRSDHEHTTCRIIIKAFGGMFLTVTEVRLVEGWYSN